MKKWKLRSSLSANTCRQQTYSCWKETMMQPHYQKPVKSPTPCCTPNNWKHHWEMCNAQTAEELRSCSEYAVPLCPFLLLLHRSYFKMLCPSMLEAGLLFQRSLLWSILLRFKVHVSCTRHYTNVKNLPQRIISEYSFLKMWQDAIFNIGTYDYLWLMII